MKVIIAGSRTITDKMLIWKAVHKSNFNITEIISGLAKGVDTVALDIAEELDVPVTAFPANWHKYGKKAGYLRNIEMANYADALIAVWDGKSKGTKMMIDIAKKKGLKVFIHEIN